MGEIFVVFLFVSLNPNNTGCIIYPWLPHIFYCPTYFTPPGFLCVKYENWSDYHLLSMMYQAVTGRTRVSTTRRGGLQVIISDEGNMIKMRDGDWGGDPGEDSVVQIFEIIIFWFNMEACQCV